MTFKTLRTRTLPTLQAELQEYEHHRTGARHIHVAQDTPELVFLVAFPTLPQVSDGRAHILEHLALCGSRRYPVRDPFFAMLRRSTAHFMNAMTYSDRTVYPFATTDRTDFFNLLGVYLDAAFFPRLDYFDFLQEGWRLAFEGDRLTYQGVVFNEMKGAFSSPQRAIDAGIHAALFKGTTYATESGGDPLAIPSLTHEALRAFHAQHYHPSQAVFMSAGKIDAEAIQQVLEEQVLHAFDARAPRMLPQLAAPLAVPQQERIAVPTGEHAVQFAWLMGESADPRALYRAQLLEDGLLGNAAAPLLYAMESAGYGRPSQLNGADPHQRQIVFHLGMEGLDENQVEPASKRIWNALEKTAEEGVPRSTLLAALRDLRFSLRDVRDGHTPDLLSRLLHALPHAMYDGDVANGLEAEAVLAELQEQTADPAFFKEMVRALLDSPARIDARIEPDADWFGARQRTEEARLAALQAALDAQEAQRIRSEAETLQARQRQPVDNGVLPRIRPADVDAAMHPLPALPREDDAIVVPIASNGVSTARVLYDVSHFDEADWPWLQLYVDVLPEMGLGDMSYDEADAWRHEAVPRFRVSLIALACRSAPDELRNNEAARIHVDICARGLREEHAGIAAVLGRTVAETRFDDHARLAYLIDSSVQDTRDMLAEEGDEYARLAACAPLGRAARFEDCTGGVRALPFLDALQDQARTPDGIAAIAARLEALHRRITALKPQILCAGMDGDAAELARAIRLPQSVTPDAKAPPNLSLPKAPALSPSLPPSLAQAAGGVALALHAPAQVNHCYIAWSVPMLDHPDAPGLAVLGELVTNQVLHQALREEGGAYGGQAAYSALGGSFVMMSYRDPRVEATYADFDRALEWIAGATPTQEQLEEAIICVIQSLDRPRTPFSQVMRAWTLREQGITQEMLERYRSGVLSCTLEQVRAAARWLQERAGSRVAFVGETGRKVPGFEAVSLMTLAGAG